jgi:flagellar hook-length control protein FliK
MVERFKAHEPQTEVQSPVVRPAARPMETVRGRTTEKPDSLTPPTVRFDALPSAPAASTVRAVEGTPAPSGADVDGTLETQIVRALRMQWGRQGGEATIHLKPEYLGNLTVSLRVEQGVVTAHLIASSAEVRQWIEANEPLLRQGLAQQHLDLDRLTVIEEESDADVGDREHGGRERRDEPRRPPTRRDLDATFEVLV